MCDLMNLMGSKVKWIIREAINVWHVSIVTVKLISAEKWLEPVRFSRIHLLVNIQIQARIRCVIIGRVPLLKRMPWFKVVLT